jgi:hypothetical protein
VNEAELLKGARAFAQTRSSCHRGSLGGIGETPPDRAASDEVRRHNDNRDGRKRCAALNNVIYGEQDAASDKGEQQLSEAEHDAREGSDSYASTGTARARLSARVRRDSAPE